MGKAGLERVKEKFSLSNTVRGYHIFIKQSENQSLLTRRMTVIEPVFDLISRLLDTTKNHKQLPVKGMETVMYTLGSV